MLNTTYFNLYCITKIVYREDINECPYGLSNCNFSYIDTLHTLQMARYINTIKWNIDCMYFKMVKTCEYTIKPVFHSSISPPLAKNFATENCS